MALLRYFVGTLYASTRVRGGLRTGPAGVFRRRRLQFSGGHRPAGAIGRSYGSVLMIVWPSLSAVVIRFMRVATSELLGDLSRVQERQSAPSWPIWASSVLPVECSICGCSSAGPTS